MISETKVQTNSDEVFERLSAMTPADLRKFFSPQHDGKDARRFEYWKRWFFPQFFFYKDAPFHKVMDQDLVDLFSLQVEDGELSLVGARDTSKTTDAKFAVVYFTLYPYYGYGIVSSKDAKNSKNFTTDVYNMLTSPRVVRVYGNVFDRDFQETTKRQQTMSVFTTRTGVRLQAVSSLQSMRGAIEQEKRPDLLIFDDFENMKTLDSFVETEKIWNYREEGINGMNNAQRKILNLANYLSESGNVHKLVSNKRGRVRILRVMEEDGTINWADKYVRTEAEAAEINVGRKPKRRVVAIEVLQRSKDFDAEYMASPKKIGDAEFPKEWIKKCFSPKAYTLSDNGLRIFSAPVAGHTYGVGSDTAEGSGRDSNTAAILDFSLSPTPVVALYANNRIDPDDFGSLLCGWGMDYNEATLAWEVNNTGHAVSAVVKRDYEGNIYRQKNIDGEQDVDTSRIGWRTTAGSKALMIAELGQALRDGDLVIPDKELADELARYTKKDKLATNGLPTRHFDLVIALAIAWQLRGEGGYVLPVFA